jgi:hypothetical protein
MSSLLVTFVRGGEAIVRIWSETECKTPAVYGPQYISTPPHPPTPQSHTDCIYCTLGKGGRGRGGHRHLQIGRMLDIDLISEPPRPSPPRCMYPKCGNLCGQRGRRQYVASWDLRMSHLCPRTPCPSAPGYRSKVESCHFAHLWGGGRRSERRYSRGATVHKLGRKYKP